MIAFEQSIFLHVRLSYNLKILCALLTACIVAVATLAGARQGYLDGKGIAAQFFHSAGMCIWSFGYGSL